MRTRPVVPGIGPDRQDRWGGHRGRCGPDGVGDGVEWVEGDTGVEEALPLERELLLDKTLD